MKNRQNRNLHNQITSPVSARSYSFQHGWMYGYQFTSAGLMRMMSRESKQFYVFTLNCCKHPDINARDAPWNPQQYSQHLLTKQNQNPQECTEFEYYTIARFTNLTTFFPQSDNREIVR